MSSYIDDSRVETMLSRLNSSKMVAPNRPKSINGTLQTSTRDIVKLESVLHTRTHTMPNREESFVEIIK